MTNFDTHTRTPAPPSPSSELRAALGQAGLRAGVADTEAGNLVRITPLDPVDAQQLARLIRTGAKRTLMAARALRKICEGYRIDLPGLRVEHGRITSAPSGSTTRHGWPGCSMRCRRPPNSQARPSTPTPSRPCSTTLSRRPQAAAPSPYPYGKAPRAICTWARSTPEPRDA